MAFCVFFNVIGVVFWLLFFPHIGKLYCHFIPKTIDSIAMFFCTLQLEKSVAVDECYCVGFGVLLVAGSILQPSPVRGLPIGMFVVEYECFAA